MKHPFILFTFLLFALVSLLASLYSFVFDVEYNKCDMTYMWQYPEYIPVTLTPSVRRKFPDYNMFVYTEGHSEPVSRSIFEGQPLLFIPGNDGSHKQVRSLASVAIQMRKTLGTKTRFDCFAVDLNSEFSALHGPFLYRQSEFVRHVVDHIESLYPSRAKFSIILVGHSMGGLVARHAITLDGFDRGRVSLIVTLATPHQRPVLATDSHMINFYAEMNNYWRKNGATTLGHVALISIGGGDRDLEVALPLTRLDGGIGLPRNTLWASSSHIRNAWASTDHRCIVWCKQLVIALCRALFSFVDDAANLNGAPSKIVATFRRHLLPSSPPPARKFVDLSTKLSASSVSQDASRWFYRDLADPRHRSFRFERDKLSRPVYLKIIAAKPDGPLVARSESAVFLLDGSGSNSDNGWLFACLDAGENVNNKPCKNLLRLDEAYARELPPSGLRRRLAEIVGDERADWLAKATAFVVVIGPSDDQTELLFELSSSSSRRLQLSWNPWPLSASLAPSASLKADQLSPGSLYSTVDLPLSWFGYEATIEATNCGALVGTPGCLAQESQSGKYIHSVQYFNQNASLALVDCVMGAGGLCRLHVVTNPLCRYRLSLRFQPQLFGAALLRYGGVTELPTWAAVHILSTVLSSMSLPPEEVDKSLLGTLIASPGLLMLTSLAACLPTVIVNFAGTISTGELVSQLIRQICLATMAAPLAAAILLSMTLLVVWLGVLLRAPRRLLMMSHGDSQGQLFSKSFANFLSPIGCILALYMTQRHCGAAGIVFLLITKLLKTAATRIDAPNESEKPSANRIIALSTLAKHYYNLSAILSLVACLCGPSLFVWAKALQSGQSVLPVADPHYSLAVALVLIYSFDAILLARERGLFYAPPLRLAWPMSLCLSVLIGASASQLHGNYAGLARLALLLLGPGTVARPILNSVGLFTSGANDSKAKEE